MQCNNHSVQDTNYLGLSLLINVKDTFDYVLYISEKEDCAHRKISQNTTKVLIHKAVLRSQSILFHELANEENYFDMHFILQPGYKTAFLELLKFMYLHNQNLIIEKKKVLVLAKFIKLNCFEKLQKDMNIFIQSNEHHASQGNEDHTYHCQPMQVENNPNHLSYITKNRENILMENNINNRKQIHWNLIMKKRKLKPLTRSQMPRLRNKKIYKKF